MNRRRPLRLAIWLMALFLFFAPFEARAHLANFGSWELTREHLGKLFPKATEFQAKKDSYSDAEVADLERKLGFKLYPEDRTPTFYIARRNGALLGVAIFIDPRVKPKLLDGAVVTLEVGIGVDPSGAVKSVKVYDYRGDLAMTRPEFLGQLEGRTLDSSFEMGEDGLVPVAGEEAESQLVANAAREALLLMQSSLSKPGESEAPRAEPSGCATGHGQPGWLVLLLFFGWMRCRNH